MKSLNICGPSRLPFWYHPCHLAGGMFNNLVPNKAGRSGARAGVTAAGCSKCFQKVPRATTFR